LVLRLLPITKTVIHTDFRPGTVVSHSSLP
jgi:hypothetical protein